MTRIRFRTDCDFDAEDAAWRKRGDSKLWMDRSQPNDTPPAEPGDCWRIRWWREDGDGPVAGYAIGCPQCGDVHRWTTAGNCGSRDGAGRCAHMDSGSCWEWTGSAEDGTLSASPSLLIVRTYSDCRFHGWLRNGELTSC